MHLALNERYMYGYYLLLRKKAGGAISLDLHSIPITAKKYYIQNRLEYIKWNEFPTFTEHERKRDFLQCNNTYCRHLLWRN